MPSAAPALPCDDRGADAIVRFIRAHCIVTAADEPLFNSRGEPQAWMLDLRPALLDADIAGLIATIFWDRFAEAWPFQIAAQELAAVPLLGVLLAAGSARGMSTNGVIVRRERKVHGRQRMIEGKLGARPIVLIDDLVNSGGAMARGIEILGAIGGRVTHAFGVLDFGSPSLPFVDRGIVYHHLFALGDLGLPIPRRSIAPAPPPLTVRWRHAAPGGFSRLIARKANPVVSGDTVLHATEAGTLHAIALNDGERSWSRQLAHRSKGLWSTPLVMGDAIYIGSYDGSVFCLDRHTGAITWRFDDADWVGSSPASDGSCLFIGLEYALNGGSGAVVALDIATGRPLWRHEIPAQVHATPVLHPDGTLICGANDGVLRCLDAATGSPLWSADLGGAIRAGVTIGPRGRRLFAGACDGRVHALRCGDGGAVWHFQTDGEICAPPLLIDDWLYVSSTDGVVYKLSAANGRLSARRRIGGKMFGTPVPDGETLIVGSTRGMLVRMARSDLRVVSAHDLGVRITSDIALAPQTLLVASAEGDLIAIATDGPTIAEERPRVPARPRASRNDRDLVIWRDFVSEAERRALVDWALEMRPHLLANRAHRQYRQTDTLPHLPDAYTAVRQRLQDHAAVTDDQREPAFGWYLSVIDSGGAVHSHLDPTRPGMRHLRCNLFLQLPEAGGLPVVEQRVQPVGERDMLAFFPSERRHRSDVVLGSRARIICSFGYLTPLDYRLPATWR